MESKKGRSRSGLFHFLLGPFHFRTKPKQENPCISMTYKKDEVRKAYRINELTGHRPKNASSAKTS